MVKVQPGVLVTSDAATITYLKFLNSALPGFNRFIIQVLDMHNLFIQAAKVKFVQEQLADRMPDTAFDEDDLANETTA
jgi:hypothetical protein